MSLRVIDYKYMQFFCVFKYFWKRWNSILSDWWFNIYLTPKWHRRRICNQTYYSLRGKPENDTRNCAELNQNPSLIGILKLIGFSGSQLIMQVCFQSFNFIYFFYSIVQTFFSLFFCSSLQTTDLCYLFCKLTLKPCLCNKNH